LEKQAKYSNAVQDRGTPIAFGWKRKPMYEVAKGHKVRPDQRSDFGLKIHEGTKRD
jgi:hypothetical protein